MFKSLKHLLKTAEYFNKKLVKDSELILKEEENIDLDPIDWNKIKRLTDKIDALNEQERQILEKEDADNLLDYEYLVKNYFK